MRSSKFGAAALLGLTLAASALAQSSAPIDATLLEVEGDVVKLNRGRESGVQIGQVFDLYKEARIYKLPLTKGEVPLVHTQQRVGRVLVFDTEPTTSRGRIVGREDKETIAVGIMALLNTTAVAPNRRPEFLAAPQPAPASWRQRVELKLAVSNEPDDAMVFSWRTTGGALEHERTLLPVNTWTAPPRAGAYQVTVEVRDSAGNVARQQVAVTSTGLQGARPLGTPKPTARTLGSGRYGAVRDVAFDRLKGDRPSRRFVLDAGQGGVFSGGDAAVVLEEPERDKSAQLRLSPGGLDVLAMAASSPTSDGPGALYCLDAKTKTVLRFPFGREWAQVLKQAPVVIGDQDGGVGNGRFKNPVDLAVSAAGECYVLDAAQGSIQAFSTQGSFLVSFGRPGTRALELQEPRAIAVGSDGTVYVLDDGRKVVVVYKGWRPVSEIAAGGPEEELVGVAVDPFTGTVFVLDRAAGVVKRFAPDGRALGRLAGEGAAALTKPTRLRADPSRVLWVMDKDGQALARFDGDGAFLGRSERYDVPAAARIAGLPNGGVAILDKSAAKVTCIDVDGWITARFGTQGEKPGELDEPVDIAVSATGEVYVLDAGKTAVLKYSPAGAYLDAIGGPNEFSGVFDLSAVNDRSYLAVLQQRDAGNFNLINPATGRAERPWGQLSGEQVPKFGCVTGITGRVDGRAGNESAKPVYWFCDDDGELLYRFQMPATTTETPLAPGIEIDAISDIEPLPTNQVVVVDQGNAQVHIFSPSGGLQTTVPSSDRMGKPTDVGIDDYGRIWVVDGSKKRVIELQD